MQKNLFQLSRLNFHLYLMKTAPNLTTKYKFCIYQCQAQKTLEIWLSPDFHLTFTWPSLDLHLTFTWLSPDLHLTFTWPLPDLYLTLITKLDWVTPTWDQLTPDRGTPSIKNPLDNFWVFVLHLTTLVL